MANLDLEPLNRDKPPVVANIPTLKRKEESCYQLSDLWNDDDHIVFLRYCINKRDRCYHAVAIDTSCRPKEILSLRIKDIVFKSKDNLQYAEVLVNGKTGPISPVLARPPISLDDRSNNVTDLPELASNVAVVRPASPPPIITTSKLSISFDIGYSI